MKIYINEQILAAVATLNEAHRALVNLSGQPCGNDDVDSLIDGATEEMDAYIGALLSYAV